MAIDSGALTGRDNPRTRDYGIALLRIMVGIVFFAHGYLKLFGFGIAGTTGFFTQIGAPLPQVSAVLITLLETVGAIALILGVFTPIVAACFIIDMLGAIYLTKLGNGFLAPKGPELELLLLVACAALILTGPGALSLQRVFRRGGAAP
jgi:putative oxidoreductase